MKRLSALKGIWQSLNLPFADRETRVSAAIADIVTRQLKLLLCYIACEHVGLSLLTFFLAKYVGIAFYHIAAAVLFLIFFRFISRKNFYIFFWLALIQSSAQSFILYLVYGDTFSVELYFFIIIPIVSHALLLPFRNKRSRNIFIVTGSAFCGLAVICFALLPYVHAVSINLSFAAFTVFKLYFIVAALGLITLETYFFAKQVSVALQNAQDLASQLSLRANFDALTGLYNRYEINHFLSDAFAAHVKRDVPLSVCMGDIDHFKQINDTYGHMAGDFVLKKVAQIMNTNIRKYSDYLGRWGGEEFLLVMPTSQSVCFKRAEALRQLIEQNTFEFEGKRISVTLTFGVAAASESTPTPEKLIALADKMLYKGKREGRNRTIGAPEEVDSSKEQQA